MVPFFKKCLLVIGLLSAPFVVEAQELAFPSAEGFGRYATGGRGGEIYKVTNLNDDGEGSLRKGIVKSSPRTIVFEVSGTIELKSPLDINRGKGNLTIAGQTAPGEGITLKGYPVSVKADNVIIRYMRFRMGDSNEAVGDALGGRDTKNVIIDHCSISWATDENASFYGNKNFTMQWCIISEALNHSVHAKGAHGYGSIWGGEKASFHHNLIANNNSRNPRFSGSETTANSEDEFVDFRNNVIYNWGSNSIYGGENGTYNMINNYFKPGPATSSSKRDRILEPYEPYGNFYIDGNFMEGSEKVTENNWRGVDVKDPVAARMEKARDVSGNVTTQRARKAYELVLKNSGASMQRDAVDNRVVNDLRKNTPTFKKGIIDSQEDVGGWPELKSGDSEKDSDNDGMPDFWEIANNLPPQKADDTAYDLHKTYTNLEVYLNDLVENPAVTTIYLAGDSTMADYSDNYEPGKDYMQTRYPLMGWGQVFQQFFVKDSLKKVNGLVKTDSVEVDDRARGGRSTRTFFQEGHWRAIYEDLEENDLVLIQFGHNDASKEKHERYVDVEGYKEFLRLFVKQTREKNAIPILLTPVARNYPWEDGELGNIHGEYDPAVKEIAKELAVHLIDLNKSSQKFFTKKGKDYVTENYFMNLPPGKYEAYLDGQNDNTHFQPEGAKAVAQLVFDEMKNFTLFKGKPISVSPYTIETTYQKLRKDYPFIKPIQPLKSGKIIARENLVYREIDGSELKADVYSPKKGKNHPAVLLIHGGGWVSGSKENQQIMGQHLAKNGYVAVVANYRLSREAKFPAAVHDLKTAISWMRKNASEFAIDKDKIAVLGTSAGAQLATLLGVTSGNKKFLEDEYKNQDQVQAIVNIDGIVSFIHPEAEESEIAGLWLGGLQTDNLQNWKDASPLEYVSENTSPTLFINSAQPRFHAGRDDMLKILEKHQIYSEVHTISDSPHSFWLMEPWFEKTLTYTLDFLDKTLKNDLK